MHVFLEQSGIRGYIQKKQNYKTEKLVVILSK